MKFQRFQKYIVPSEKYSQSTSFVEFKHQFYPISPDEVIEVSMSMKIPDELKEFYTNIGYGFLFHQNHDYFDRLIDVVNFRAINLREDYHEYDPDLELYISPNYKDKLIFFEVSEGVYLLISVESIKGENAIFYFNTKIADSLDEFLTRFDKEGHYFL